MSDDSGHHSQPFPNSKLPAHLRVDYLTHSLISSFLIGDGLKPFARRFTSNLAERLSKIESIDTEWSNLPDLFEFIQAELFPATLEAMWGKEFFLINPTFTRDFWAFSKVLSGLAKGYPRWLFPGRYQARNRCFASIKCWHAFIRTRFDHPSVVNLDWNEDYGAELVKSRHMAWSLMPRMNANAAATEDFGMVWAYMQPLF